MNRTIERAISELLTIEQVGKKLNISTSGMRKLVARKVIPIYKLGHRCIRFHWPEVEEALARHRQGEIK